MRTPVVLAGFWGIVTMASAATLVDQGRPTATIITPARPRPAVALAASELQRYLEQISGAKLPVVADGQAVTGFAIHVGPTIAAKPLTPREPEGILVQGDDRRLILTGGSDQAVLFAVYRCLEQSLGCRWLAPEVEIVPRRPTIKLAPLKLSGAPSFDLRVFVAGADAARAWATKVGLNGFFDAAHAAEVGGGYYLPQAIEGCHAYHQIMPTERYLSTHPEWFPLINGQRFKSSADTGQLCVTAPGLADEFARRVGEVFDRDPALRITSISPNDGYNWCECPQCLALDQQLNGGRTTKQGLSSEKPFMGDRVFWFANQVGERLAKTHPGKQLLVLAYVNYAEPPDTIKPLPNVIPWLCHYAPADYSRPISDPTSAPNAQFNALLTKWAKIAPRLLFYGYVSKSMWWRLPRPVIHNFAADLKYLQRLGLHRYYCQSGLNDWPLDGPLYYVLAKLMWNIEADPDALAREWMGGMFGPAAMEMRQYYDAVERSVRRTGKSYSDNPPWQVPGLYDHDELRRAQAHLDAALAAAPAGDYHDHVRQVAQVFAYGVHMIAGLEAGERFRAGLDPADLAIAREELTAALKLCPVRESQVYLDGLKRWLDLGVLARGFGAAETKGGRQCWNTDETGVGDGKAGWADMVVGSPDTTQPLVLEMDVWGTSALSSLVINTDGSGKGTADGGVWTTVLPDRPLSGQAQWDTLTFRLPAAVLAPGRKTQRIGMGGGDSQIWVAQVRVRPVP